MPIFSLKRCRTLPAVSSHNRLVDAGRVLQQGFTAAGGVSGAMTPGGPKLGFPPDDEIIGEITGNLGGGGYSWAYVATRPLGAAPVVVRDATGSTAWEINKRLGVPVGAVVELLPGFEGDRRFQFLRMGSPGVCSFTICVVCTTTAESGAVVTISTLGGTQVFSGTTGTNGCLTITTVPAGTYQVTASQSGLSPFSGIMAIACNAEIVINLCCPFSILVVGCNDLPAGAGNSVTVTNGRTGAAIASGETDGTGTFNFTFPPGSVPSSISITATPSGELPYEPGTGAFVSPVQCEDSASVAITPSAGFVCQPCAGLDPVAETLTLNDGFGDVTMTFDGDNWTGCALRTFTNIECADEAGPVTVDLPVFFQAACVGDGSQWEVVASVIILGSSGTIVTGPPGGVGAPFCLLGNCSTTPSQTFSFGVLWTIIAVPASYFPFDFSGSVTTGPCDPGGLACNCWGDTVSVTMTA
jgi:hypothetical protein